jgi:hypothetical protein
MSIYVKYPSKKEMPSRLARKGNRNKVFQANKRASKELHTKQALARQARLESELPTD